MTVIFMNFTMSRRIKTELEYFFKTHPLTDWEKSFILGCIKAQKQHPQLTPKQWRIVCNIKERYANAEIESDKTSTKR